MWWWRGHCGEVMILTCDYTLTIECHGDVSGCELESGTDSDAVIAVARA